MDKYLFESLLTEINIKSEILFLCSEFKKENKIKSELKEILIKIFNLNGFKISEKTINKYFSNSIDFITYNLKDNVIKSSKDLKYYIQSELVLNIENNEFLFRKYFNNQYKEIKEFLFIEI